MSFTVGGYSPNIGSVKACTENEKGHRFQCPRIGSSDDFDTVGQTVNREIDDYWCPHLQNHHQDQFSDECCVVHNITTFPDIHMGTLGIPFEFLELFFGTPPRTCHP